MVVEKLAEETVVLIPSGIVPVALIPTDPQFNASTPLAKLFDQLAMSEKFQVLSPDAKLYAVCPITPFTPISKSDNTVINFLNDLWPMKELEILFEDIKIGLNTTANKQFLQRDLIKFRLSIYYF